MGSRRSPRAHAGIAGGEFLEELRELEYRSFARAAGPGDGASARSGRTAVIAEAIEEPRRTGCHDAGEDGVLAFDLP